MQKQKIEIKKNIERAAIQEFLAKGFLGASIRSIAKEAGVSKSNVYNYFKNKEELFYSLCEPAYHQIHSLLLCAMQAESDESFSNSYFVETFTTLLSNKIIELVTNHREQLLLLLDCSIGTKYEQTKEELVTKLEHHFIEDIHTPHNNSVDNAFVMHIIATNLLEGILEIAKHYKNEQWANVVIPGYLHYHVKGMTQFFS